MCAFEAHLGRIFGRIFGRISELHRSGRAHVYPVGRRKIGIGKTNRKYQETKIENYLQCTGTSLFTPFQRFLNGWSSGGDHPFLRLPGASHRQGLRGGLWYLVPPGLRRSKARRLRVKLAYVPTFNGPFSAVSTSAKVCQKWIRCY